MRPAGARPARGGAGKAAGPTTGLPAMAGGEAPIVPTNKTRGGPDSPRHLQARGLTDVFWPSLAFGGNLFWRRASQTSKTPRDLRQLMRFFLVTGRKKARFPGGLNSTGTSFPDVCRSTGPRLIRRAGRSFLGAGVKWKPEIGLIPFFPFQGGKGEQEEGRSGAGPGPRLGFGRGLNAGQGALGNFRFPKGTPPSGPRFPARELLPRGNDAEQRRSASKGPELDSFKPFHA